MVQKRGRAAGARSAVHTQALKKKTSAKPGPKAAGKKPAGRKTGAGGAERKTGAATAGRTPGTGAAGRKAGTATAGRKTGTRAAGRAPGRTGKKRRSNTAKRTVHSSSARQKSQKKKLQRSQSGSSRRSYRRITGVLAVIFAAILSVSFLYSDGTWLQHAGNYVSQLSELSWDQIGGRISAALSGRPSQTGSGIALPSASPTAIAASDIPPYSGSPYTELNGNLPLFTEEDLTTTAYEQYAPLDGLGRCGITQACVGQEIMPVEERGAIGQVRPTGWHTVKYDFIDGKYLYNRCHLIGYQLTGENANPQNLITGTRYLNIEGMLDFEDQVASYVRTTGNHVMYRVTPVFDGSNLLASGVEMEGYSVEDGGAGVCFHVFAYNVQPGVVIDYATGDSRAE